MRLRQLVVLMAICLAGFAGVQGQENRNVDFGTYFYDATMRVDYIRRGNLQHDTVLLKEIAIQNPDLWAGSTTQLLDPVNNGEYRVVVKEAATGRELYSRTYTTLFNEYRDTPAGKDSVADFEEVVLIPYPKVEVEICMQKRDAQLRFFTAATFRYPESNRIYEFDGTSGELKPTSYGFAVVPPKAKPVRLLYNGDSHKKIDVVIVAEGYGKKDKKKMEGDFKKFTEYLLAQEPFSRRRGDFNVWGIGVLAAESGVTDPTEGRYVSSAVGSSYNTFGSDRYLMTTRLFQLHNLLAGCPYDHIIIMGNCDTYGGGAIYNFYAFSAVQEMSQWILPHELGHSIGGLADEYVDEELSYNDIHKLELEPVQPNITTLVDFASKWADLVDEGTAVPTPPVKGLGPRACGPVGVYEGAGYKAKGIYRPCTNCMMNYYAAFCPVCHRTLNRMFDLYTK